jgi:ABC-type glycerol-3-phosphate transport system substrate-binding protein
MKKRNAGIMALMLSVSMAFSGCSGGEATQTAPGMADNAPKGDAAKKTEPVTISLTWGTMPDVVKERWMKYLIQPFEKDNPNIKVDLRTIPDALSAVKVQIASGEGPDMFMVDAFDLKNFVDADRIIPLDKYVQQYNWDKIVSHGPCRLANTKVSNGVFQEPTRPPTCCITRICLTRTGGLSPRQELNSRRSMKKP